MMNDNKNIWEFHEAENRRAFLLGRPRLDYLSKRISKSDRMPQILDIGIGDGYLLDKLSNQCHLYGIDISEGNVMRTSSQLQQKKVNAEIKLGGIDKIPFNDSLFDYVFASDVLEHLETEILQRGLQEIQRILKNGGTFIGTVPAEEELRDNLCYCPKCGYSFHRWGHQQAFTREQLEKIFLEHGFHVEQISRVTFFAGQLTNSGLIAKAKYHLAKTLFFFLKRVFAPQWWFYFQVINDKSS